MKKIILILLILCLTICCFVGCSKQEKQEQYIDIEADNLRDEAVAVAEVSKDITLWKIEPSISSFSPAKHIVEEDNLQTVKSKINELINLIGVSKYTEEEYVVVLGDENTYFDTGYLSPLSIHGFFQIIVKYGNHTIYLRFYDDKLAIYNTTLNEFFTLNQSSANIVNDLIALMPEVISPYR